MSSLCSEERRKEVLAALVHREGLSITREGLKLGLSLGSVCSCIVEELTP